jgi:hypothetical protein
MVSIQTSIMDMGRHVQEYDSLVFRALSKAHVSPFSEVLGGLVCASFPAAIYTSAGVSASVDGDNAL